MTETSQTVLILLHERDAGPANLGVWLDEQGIEWQLVDVPAEPLPPVAPRRALVVLGSRESAYDEGVPWIAGEREFVAATAATGTPVLGLCFGGQLLAQVLGGSVGKAEQGERGWTEVSYVGAPDPEVAELFDRRWLEWHDDDITPPPHATVLARSARCVQAFAEGPHLGLQFHPEARGEEIRAWLRGDKQLNETPGEADELLRMTELHEAPTRAAAGRLYGRFLAGGFRAG